MTTCPRAGASWTIARADLSTDCRPLRRLSIDDSEAPKPQPRVMSDAFVQVTEVIEPLDRGLVHHPSEC